MTEIATTGSERACMEPQWLDSHMPGTRVQASREEVQDTLAAARRSLEVAGERELLILLREALSIFELPDNWESQSSVYVGALEDLPADLVRMGLGHVVKTYEYKFPKPASIRKPVEEEFCRRRATVVRLETILQAGKFKEPERLPRTAEETQAGLEMFAKVKAVLNQTTDSLKA